MAVFLFGDIMANARFLIPRPAESDNGIVTEDKGDGLKVAYQVYRTAEGEDLKWSARFPLPQIGDRIKITMNGIGDAAVVGFFSEEGFVGVMTRAFNPPKWQSKQRERDRRSSGWNSRPNWYKEGIGREFGTEIALL